MKSRRLFQLILSMLFLLPPLAEAGKCTGRLTLEQYQACQALKAHNAPEERKSRAAVQDADRRYQAQREAEVRASEAAQAKAEAEAHALEARALAAQQAAQQAAIQALIKETKEARREADSAEAEARRAESEAQAARLR